MENIHKNKIPIYQYCAWVGSDNTNGAGSILRKVATQLGISLAEVGKAALTLPKRYDVHLVRRSYRKNGEMCLQTVSE